MPTRRPGDAYLGDGYEYLNRDSVFSRRDGWLPTGDRSPDTRGIPAAVRPPWDRYPNNNRDVFLGGAGQFSGGGQIPGGSGRFGGPRDSSARNPSFHDLPDNTDNRYPPYSDERTYDTYPGTRDRGVFGRGWRHDSRGNSRDEQSRDGGRDRFPTDSDSYPNKNGTPYPNTDDRFPDTSTSHYPGPDRDRYPTDRDRYPTDRDRYPDTDRDRYPGPDRSPGRPNRDHDVRRCPEQPTFEKIVNMRYEPADRSLPEPTMERGGTMAALRQVTGASAGACDLSDCAALAVYRKKNPPVLFAKR